MAIAEKDITKIMPTLREIAVEVATIPLRQKLEEIPRVLIVGEIYVRRDDFAVDELVGLFSSKGIMAKIAGIGEWIHYLDFVREYDLKKRLRLLPPAQAALLGGGQEAPAPADRGGLEALGREPRQARPGARPSSSPIRPTTCARSWPTPRSYFVNHELNSEIAVSSGVAATAMEEGYSGIVNISPFACLIGRVIEGLLTPWARERDYPVISVEVDGNQLPPSIVNKLNIFMVNVLRHGGGDNIGVLIEELAKAEAEVEETVAEKVDA